MSNLIDILEQGINQIDAERGDWDETVIHISDFGAWDGLPDSDRKCPRALWYRLNGCEREPHTAGEKLMFAQGHHLEKIVIDALAEQGVVIDVHGSVSTGLVHGTYDCILSLPEISEYPIVMDVKTRRGNAFRYSKGVKPAEKMQVLAYTSCLPAPYEKGIILEVDREGQNFAREWVFDIGAEELKDVGKAQKYCLDIAESDTPPDGIKATLIRKVNKKSDSLLLDVPWQCRWCKYAKPTCDFCLKPEMAEMHGRVVGHVGADDVIVGLKELNIQEEKES
jgi:hypothetical protein